MNSWDATAPFPLSRRDMLKTRSWRHGTLTKFILLSTFIFNLLTFRNLSQRLKVKNGDFKHFTCISAWEIRAWHVQSHPGWVGPPKFFWGFFSHGIYVWAYTRQNLRNFGFLNHPKLFIQNFILKVPTKILAKTSGNPKMLMAKMAIK